LPYLIQAHLRLHHRHLIWKALIPIRSYTVQVPTLI
jgi:hypothetical protein